MIYPWQIETWQHLQAQFDRLPHAILLTGEAGLGKLDFARHLAYALLCESSDASAKPCGVCLACRWLDAGNHPDFREITPQNDDEASDSKAAKKKSEVIKIDQVRELADFVNLTSHRAGRKVVIVHPAEALNREAANALLKTLEEPPAGAVFILVSHQWRRLLPTLRSRCRRLPMPMPATEIALQWLSEQGLADAEALLAETGGAPLAAISHADAGYGEVRDALLADLAQPAAMDALQVAERLDKAKAEPERVLGWLTRWNYDLLRVALAESVRYYPLRRAALSNIGSQADTRRLLRYQDELIAASRLAHHPLNVRLVFERALLGYLQAVRI